MINHNMNVIITINHPPELSSTVAGKGRLAYACLMKGSRVVVTDPGCCCRRTGSTLTGSR